MERTILHINIPSFYCSVAQINTPSLAGFPIAVATTGSQHRIILDVSLQAKEAGVHKGMHVNAALRQCRDLVVHAPVPYVYAQISKKLMAEAAHYSPFVEPAGPGHFFVDLSGTERLAQRLTQQKKCVRQSTLPVTSNAHQDSHRTSSSVKLLRVSLPLPASVRLS